MSCERTWSGSRFADGIYEIIVGIERAKFSFIDWNSARDQ
jgi:hypothetical protein